MSEEKQTQQTEEVREEIHYIGGEYLSAATSMVAWQFIDGIELGQEEEPKTYEEFMERCAYLLRQHAPIAYSYFFQHIPSVGPLPQGTVDIILQEVRREIPHFLGGKPRSGIILQD